MLIFSRDINEGTYRIGEGGGGPAISDPESELLLGGKARVVRRGYINGVSNRGKKRKMDGPSGCDVRPFQILLLLLHV